MEKTKICISCNKEKDLKTGFYKINNKDGSYYYRNRCKECIKNDRRSAFDKDEIDDLKEIIKRYRENKQLVNDYLLNKFKKETIRQTYIIEKDLLQAIEDYCKENRINKSDLVNIAIRKIIFKDIKF